MFAHCRDIQNHCRRIERNFCQRKNRISFLVVQNNSKPFYSVFARTYFTMYFCSAHLCIAFFGHQNAYASFPYTLWLLISYVVEPTPQRLYAWCRSFVYEKISEEGEREYSPSIHHSIPFMHWL